MSSSFGFVGEEVETDEVVSLGDVGLVDDSEGLAGEERLSCKDGSSRSKSWLPSDDSCSSLGPLAGVLRRRNLDWTNEVGDVVSRIRRLQRRPIEREDVVLPRSLLLESSLRSSES